jgi:hypothetical protein
VLNVQFGARKIMNAITALLNDAVELLNSRLPPSFNSRAVRGLKPQAKMANMIASKMGA